MKPKGLGELCAATSNLANQTGIEKTDLLIIHKPNLISSNLKKHKCAMETRGPKSNLSKLLCLSWLSATLMMIRSNMNELAWRHHFPIISLKGNFLNAQGQLTPLSVVRSGRNSNLPEILCMSSLPASIKRIGSKTTKKR